MLMFFIKRKFELGGTSSGILAGAIWGAKIGAHYGLAGGPGGAVRVGAECGSRDGVPMPTLWFGGRVPGEAGDPAGSAVALWTGCLT